MTDEELARLYDQRPPQWRRAVRRPPPPRLSPPAHLTVWQTAAWILMGVIVGTGAGAMVWLLVR